MENWLTKRAQLSPDHLAVQYQETKLTFAQMNDQVQHIATQLAQIAQNEERIAVITSNQLQGYLMILAVQQLGKTIVLINRRLSAREIDFQLQDAGIQVVVQDNDFHLTLSVNKQVSFAEVLAIPVTELINPVAEFDLNKVTSIMYTSGTTGNPKGVMQTFGNHFYSAIGSALNLGIMTEDVWLAVVPIFHISGLSIMMRSLIYGMGVRLFEKFDVHVINKILLSGEVTTISVVPMMLTQLLSDLPAGTRYHKNFRTMLLGGGPTDLTTLQRATAAGIEVVQSYGMTETASQVIALDAANAQRKIGSAGKPLFPVSVRIAHQDENRHGRIQIKSPTLAVGYLNQPEKYANTFENGWFDTGDMGWLDDEGFLYIDGREGDMISSGGENVFPDEIESIYAKLDAIKQIAVVGVPDEKWGAVPVAFVTFTAGKSLSRQELRNFGRDMLAHYKVPAHFYNTSELPRTASGKVQRHKLPHLIAKASEVK